MPKRGRPRLPVPSVTKLTPRGTRRQCSLHATPTPGGTTRSLSYMQEVTPAAERPSARKRRLDRNRQSAKYAAVKAARGNFRLAQRALVGCVGP